MLDLKLRDEFKGKKLKGTTIDFTNQSKTGALEVSAAEFLKITYPSHDLLKTIETTGPSQSRPVVLLGGRGQGKSHLLAALYHLCTNPDAGRQWLTEWASNLDKPLFANIKLRNESCVIAESLHLNRYTFLWDVLFDRHPHGPYCRGMWETPGPEKKTEVPSDLILLEMFRKKPTVLILDEFQTWFDGQTNTKQYPRKKWAFNFIQVLSEIAQSNPELLVLVVSVRENESDAYQQVHRVNPVLVDFKGPQAKRDRQRLLLYRIFENRMQVPPSKIESLVKPHISEYFRLGKVPQPEQERRHSDFIEAWPYSPLLLKLLDDQVLIATSAQETRDLIKMLVDLFKNTDQKSPIITAADFKLNSESSVVASLLDSVANQLHKDLREKAQRNLQAVMDAVPNAKTILPHSEEIISALWLRSLTVDRLVGADPAELQIDITRGKAIDDNQFSGELANIEENSFNIHRIGIRLVFKSEENPQAKLLAHAKNDKLFPQGEDVDHLAKEIRACISGPEHVSQNYRIVVLKKKWQINPWSEFEEKDHPKNWDARLPMIVVPESPEKLEATLGNWLKSHLQDGRNTIRFLLPQRGTGNVYYDRELVILARAVYLAMQWSETDPVYRSLKTKFQNELTGKLKNRFDRFTVLDTWNFAEPAKCKFEERSHGAQGDKIPETVDKIIKQDVFIPEEFEAYVLKLAEGAESVGKLLKDLREPRPGGNPCIPWLGEVEVKERVIKMCAAGQIAINVRGLEMLQARPGETYDDAWTRMKGRLGVGKHLDETTIYLPDAVVTSGGKNPVVAVSGDSPLFPKPGLAVPGDTIIDDDGPGDLFGGTGTKLASTKKPFSASPTSGLNLLGQVESWGIGPATSITNVSLKVGKLTGSQLQQLLKHLPDGVTYGLDLEKGGDLMPCASDLLTVATTKPADQAWASIIDHLWKEFSAEMPPAAADAEVVKRDRGLTELDNIISGASWDLWSDFETVVPKASQAIVDFWTKTQGGKAVLILDGLSLREVPWLLGQAKQRGYKRHEAGVRGSELPAETTQFANSLGFAQRSSLENNGAGSAHKLKGAYTISCDLPWQECVDQVGGQEAVVFWHHWPDERLHKLAVPGGGLHKLAKEIHAGLTSDDFWLLVERISTGRKLFITSDHGYAATGMFPDLTDKDQVNYMKTLFKSGRSSSDKADDGSWVPPIDIKLNTDHGDHRYVLGRRKWKSAAGYPTLQHGGLSLLEVFVPYVVLSK